MDGGDKLTHCEVNTIDSVLHGRSEIAFIAACWVPPKRFWDSGFLPLRPPPLAPEQFYRTGGRIGVGGREEASSLTQVRPLERQVGRELSTRTQPAQRSRSSYRFRSGASPPWNQIPASFRSGSGLLSS